LVELAEAAGLLAADPVETTIAVEAVQVRHTVAAEAAEDRPARRWSRLATAAPAAQVS
jgi:hypothetical protein